MLPILLLILASPFVAVFILVASYFSMGTSFAGVFHGLSTRLGDTYNYLTDGEVSYAKEFSVLRHSRPFVVYQGVKTEVIISVFGAKPLPPKRRVFLQKRGYRTGLLGWTIGGLLGGSKIPGIEVTPVEQQSFSDLSSSQQSRLKSDVDRLFSPSSNPNQPLQQTLRLHVPVSSGDGYFRFRITTENPRQAIAESPVFRVGSLTLSTAQPQGASLIGIGPELVVRTLVIAGRSAAYASFYAAFPFLKLAAWTPGPWKAWAVRTIYGYGGGDQLNERYQISENIGKANEQLKKANEKMYKVIPFGTVGVRTAADILKDEELGRQGMWCVHDPKR
ncbi:hypothetical protein SISSUDRAFT_1033492 [Sistotremastrum suecicum HHB10207 ss-3]|uniref:Uncharacterized protein n=1 Tax=Sistotremastrum suecicum HHB10207 ss-3 TaxID=1314776 RepID=A0A166D913_9AGAM|nr:hypothetical protein SISSUDRAFT_1033492 [Sistotremastrum suecicum HHB10207 ss-3]